MKFYKLLLIYPLFLFNVLFIAFTTIKIIPFNPYFHIIIIIIDLLIAVYIRKSLDKEKEN